MNLTVSLIIDFIIVAFLAIFIYRGAKQGLFITVFTMLAVFWALSCGWFLSTHYADGLINTFRPGIESKINSYIATNSGVADSSTPQEMGYSEAFNEAVENQTIQLGSASVSASSLGDSIASIMARSAMFLVGFLAVMLLWTLLARGLSLVTRFPVLHLADRVLGGVMGLFLGYIFLLLVHWVLFDLLPFLPKDLLDGCHFAPLLVSRPFFFLIGT